MRGSTEGRASGMALGGIDGERRESSERDSNLQCGFGALIGIGAFFAPTRLGSSPEFWGFRRCIAIGVPLAIVSGRHLFSGVMIILTRSRWAIAAAILSAFTMAVFYFAFEISMIGLLKARLMSVLVYALPILLIVRSTVAISHVKSQNAQQTDPTAL